MSYILVFTEQYNRCALHFIKRHPDLKKQYLKSFTSRFASTSFARKAKVFTVSLYQYVLSNYAGIIDK